MNLESLLKLYVHELKDLHSAENQILDALPGVIKKASDNGLKEALQHHKSETQTHINRIERLFKDLEFEPGGHRCQGMAGLITEANHVMDDCEDDDVRDAAIISMCQRFEHYEMAAYGSARAFARQLGRWSDVEVLSETLDEEAAADRKLSRLAERRINFAAMNL